MSDRMEALIPTTYIWDEIEGAANPELLVRLYQYVAQMATSINQKDSGFYGTEINVTGQNWFPDGDSLTPGIPPQYRGTYRKTIYINQPLPNAGTLSIPHGIPLTPTTTFTYLDGTANDTSGKMYVKLPNSSPVLTDCIAAYISGANLVITTGSDRSGCTKNYVTVEFMIS